MYEEDFIVKNFLKNVIHPVSCRYTIHLIANVDKIEIRDSLIDQMKSKLKYQDRIGFVTFVDRLAVKNYNGPTIYRDLNEERLIEQRQSIIEKVGPKMLSSTVDFSITAAAQTENFYFWNAIQSYKRDIRVNQKSKFYEQRACLHMCLDEWSKAYSLSKKSHNPEYISVLAFSFGHFEVVLQNLDFLFLLIRERKTTIISIFELLHIITFSILCCFNFTSNEDPVLDRLLQFLQEENLSKPKMAIKQFLQSKYCSVINWIDSLENFASLSLYMCFSFSMIQEAIRENALIHFCYPYNSIKLSKVADQFQINEEQTEEIIQKICLKGKLNFQIDYIDKTLQRVPKFRENYEKQIVLKQSNATMIKLDESLWKMTIKKPDDDFLFKDDFVSTTGSQI